MKNNSVVKEVSTEVISLSLNKLWRYLLPTVTSIQSVKWISQWQARLVITATDSYRFAIFRL